MPGALLLILSEVLVLLDYVSVDIEPVRAPGQRNLHRKGRPAEQVLTTSGGVIFISGQHCDHAAHRPGQPERRGSALPLATRHEQHRRRLGPIRAVFSATLLRSAETQAFLMIFEVLQTPSCSGSESGSNPQKSWPCSGVAAKLSESVGASEDGGSGEDDSGGDSGRGGR